MEPADLDVLKARLQKVEQRLSVVLVGSAVCLSVLVALTLWSQSATSQQEVLEARAFRVVDTRGRPRIEIGIDRFAGVPLTGVGAIRFLDEDGKERISMGFTAGQPMLLLQDREGRTISFFTFGGMSITDGSDGKIQLSVVGGNPMASLSGLKGGLLFAPPQIILLDDPKLGSSKKIHIFLSKDGRLVFMDANGRVLGRVPN